MEESLRKDLPLVQYQCAHGDASPVPQSVMRRGITTDYTVRVTVCHLGFSVGVAGALVLVLRILKYHRCQRSSNGMFSGATKRLNNSMTSNSSSVVSLLAASFLLAETPNNSSATLRILGEKYVLINFSRCGISGCIRCCTPQIPPSDDGGGVLGHGGNCLGTERRYGHLPFRVRKVTSVAASRKVATSEGVRIDRTTTNPSR